MVSVTSELVVKNTVWLMAGRLVSRVFQFLLIIYAARVLGVGRFGVFSYGLALISLVSVFFDMGVSSYCIVKTSKDRGQMPIYTGASLVLRTYLGIIGLVLVVGFVKSVGREPEAMAVVLMLGVQAIFNSLTAAFSSELQSRERMNEEAILTTVSGLTTTVVGFALLWAYSDLLLFATAFAFGAAVKFGFYGWWCVRRYGRPVLIHDRGFMLELLKGGVPFALVTIFVTVYYYIDTLIIGLYEGDKAVGLYNAAFRMLEAPLFLISAFTTAIFPSISRMSMEDRDGLKGFIEQAFLRGAALGLFIALTVAFFSKELVSILYGRDYLEAAAVVPPLVFSIGLIFPSTILGTTIRAIGRQWVSAWVTGLGALLNIVLNLIFIPRYSYRGAAWTTLSTEVFVLLVYAVLITRWLGSPIRTTSVIKLSVVNLILFAFLFATTGFGMWLQLVGCVLIFPILLLITGVLSQQDIKGLIRILLPSRKEAMV